MNIGVVFGSRSPEHDVSIASAFGVMQAIKKHTDHKAIPLYITRDGNWILHPDLTDIRSFKKIEEYAPVTFPKIEKKDGKTYFSATKGGFFTKKKIEFQIDVLWNICHGENGEDGIVSALAKLISLPIVSPGVFAESTGTNKLTMKTYFKALGLPQVPYSVWKKNNIDVDAIEEKHTYPVFVKPNSLGSTIGVSKCDTRDELEAGITVATYFDDTIIVEDAVASCREFNCSVMEIDGKITPSLVEEPTTKEAFLTFDEKYTSSSGGTMKGVKSKVKVPAEISSELTKKIQDFAATIYREMQLEGGAPRIDFLYNNKLGELYVNEINLTPGSMQLHLRVQSGYSVHDFIENCLHTAQEHLVSTQKNIDYPSEIVEQTISFIESQGE